MSADRLRNEVVITLAGQERIMRATFKAMRAIEVSTGKSWSALGQLLTSGNYGVGDVTKIVHHGLIGAEDTRLNEEAVGEAIVDAGLNNVMMPVVEFLAIGFTGAKPLGKSEVLTAA